MRDQYAGDLSDLIKFSFLRALAASDRKLGVAWYYAPGDDGRPDGRHIEHRAETSWRALDADVHGALAALDGRSVAALEQLTVWPAETSFHRDAVPRGRREGWLSGMRDALRSADLVFLDPDNGLGHDPEKHAQISDLHELAREGRTLVVIKFPGRTKYETQISDVHAQLQAAGFRGIATLRTNVSVPTHSDSRRVVQRPRFFTLISADETLIERTRLFAERFSRLPNARASMHTAEDSESPEGARGGRRRRLSGASRRADHRSELLEG